ncbi:MAG TPA: aminotransferase class IV, partial [Rhizomicrobium sp.]
MIMWLNGKLTANDAARIDPADRGFTLGDGLFETFVARDGKIPHLAAHLERLRQGCTVLRMTYPVADIAAAANDLLQANALTDAVIRLTYSRGPAPRGVLPPTETHPTLLITAAPIPAPLTPARCIVASVTRRNEYSPLCRIKSLNYLDAILARQEAHTHAADEAILLNTQGRVTETTVANLFIVKVGQVLTPPLKDGCLPGVMRAAVIALGGVKEQSLGVEDLASADEIFLSNSLGLRAVA